MNKHVVSKELAQKLKAAGFPQGKSLFVLTNMDRLILREKTFEAHYEPAIYGGTPFVDAPLATEILEELPAEIKTKVESRNRLNGEIRNYELKVEFYDDGEVEVWYQYDDCYSGECDSYALDRKLGKNLLEALAKMYIYLAENGLLTK